MPFQGNARRKPARVRGAAAVEFSVLLPLFMMIMFAQIESARLGMVVQLLTTAAREGCRVAVLNGTSQSDVQNMVATVLSGSGVPVPTVNPTPSNWASSARGTPITVSLSVPYSQVTWMPNLSYFNVPNLSASATMSSERP